MSVTVKVFEDVGSGGSVTSVTTVSSVDFFDVRLMWLRGCVFVSVTWDELVVGDRVYILFQKGMFSVRLSKSSSLTWWSACV